MNQKEKAELDFHLEAMREAIARMGADLKIANNAAHEVLERRCGDDEDFALEALEDLGLLVMKLTHDLCPARRRLLLELADALDHIEGEHKEAA